MVGMVSFAVLLFSSQYSTSVATTPCRNISNFFLKTTISVISKQNCSLDGVTGPSVLLRTGNQTIQSILKIICARISFRPMLKVRAVMFSITY